MSTIKNGQNSLYCHLDKVINGFGASFQSLALSKKHVTNVCHTAHQYLTKFHFSSTEDSKETKISVNFHYVAMPMMASHILKFVDFAKTQNSKYHGNNTFCFFK